MWKLGINEAVRNCVKSSKDGQVWEDKKVIAVGMKWQKQILEIQQWKFYMPWRPIESEALETMVWKELAWRKQLFSSPEKITILIAKANVIKKPCHSWFARCIPSSKAL